MRKSSKKFQKDIENNISIWYNLNIEKNITNEREKSNEKTKIKRNKSHKPFTIERAVRWHRFLYWKTS